MPAHIRMYYKSITALLLSFCLNGAKSEPINPDVKAILNGLHPLGGIEQVEAGDLDGDGRLDIAYLVKWYNPIRLVIGVLRRTPDGSLTKWIHTDPFNMAQRAPVLEIRGKSLYISQLLNGLSWSHTTNDQYLIKNGKLVLVGTEDSMRHPAFDTDPGPHEEIITSTNYLTCRAIETTIKNKKRTEVAFNIEDCKLQTLEETYE